MSDYRRRVLVGLLKLSDMVILLMGLSASSWYAAAQNADMNLAGFLSVRIKLINMVGLLAMLFLWHVICFHLGLYNSRRLQAAGQEIKDIIKATSLGTIVFVVGAHLFDVILFTPVFISFFWISTTVTTIFFRILLRQFLKKLRLQGRNLRFVLIIGTNERAYEYAEMIKQKRESGYRIVGFVDDRIHMPKPGIRLLGHLGDLPHMEVVIALPVKSQYDNIQKIIERAEEQGVMVRCLPHLFNTKISVLNAATLGGIPVLEMSSRQPEDWRFVAKRALDITAGCILLVLASPVMMAAAVAIKLTSRGPVFFVQPRVGYNKRIFNLYKFRTMVENAERMQRVLEGSNEMDGPVFKIENDPRVTGVGRWLRKTSIDELPQLYNVIRGDMSLVGPRPLPVRDYRGFEKDWQRRRFSIRPGLTCLWQVMGRNGTTFEEWMNLDMEYIDNWSLAGDMKILFQTIPVVINGKGAS